MTEVISRDQLIRRWWHGVCTASQKELSMLKPANFQHHYTRLDQLVQERDEIVGLRQILRCLVPEVDWDAHDAQDLLRRAKAVLAREFQPEAVDG